MNPTEGSLMVVLLWLGHGDMKYQRTGKVRKLCELLKINVCRKVKVNTIRLLLFVFVFTLFI